MHLANTTDITQFFVVGINYKKSDAAIRGQFAVDNDQHAQILHNARTAGISELFVLSTCNRTEVYGIARSPLLLIELLCAETQGTRETFERLCYVRNGQEAIEHLFNVGAGLDSQILGDYEIVGQIKSAAKFACT